MITIQRLMVSSKPIVDMLNHLLQQLSDSPAELTEGALEHILRSDTQVYVAVDDGYIIGSGTLAITYPISGVKCWIEDVVIDEMYQGQGLGKKLMEHLIAQAPVYASSINLTSSHRRQAARTLYAQLGFEERQDSSLFRLIQS